MSQFFAIHPENPQPRLLRQASEILKKSGLIIYPTDSCYALGCRLGEKAPLERLRKIRGVDDRHAFTLVCPDLSSIAEYAQVDNSTYRLLKRYTPGPFTFVLPATRKLPRNAWNKPRTLGIRVPDNRIVHDMLADLGEPIISSTLIPLGEDLPVTDPWEARDVFEHSVDLIIDGGHCGLQPTTVLDLSADVPRVLREGAGDASAILAEY